MSIKTLHPPLSLKPSHFTSQEREGFFPAHYGQLVGPDDRYRMLRMLGAGKHSSVFLVEDLEYVVNVSLRPSANFPRDRLSIAEPDFRDPILCGRRAVIKILTTWATTENFEGRLHELQAMQALAASTSVICDGSLFYKSMTHFEIVGPRGTHLCLVLGRGSDTVESVHQSSPSKTILPNLVQYIAGCTLNNLADIHGQNIVHAGEIRFSSAMHVRS